MLTPINLILSHKFIINTHSMSNDHQKAVLYIRSNDDDKVLLENDLDVVLQLNHISHCLK